MGLDSYWVMPGESQTNEVPLPVFDPPLCLVTGIAAEMMYEGGPRFFRGKVYNQIIEAVSGQDLYHEEIHNNKCREIASYLERYDPVANIAELRVLFWTSATDEDIIVHFKDLTRMFKAFSEAGAKLCGWW